MKPQGKAAGGSRKDPGASLSQLDRDGGCSWWGGREHEGGCEGRCEGTDIIRHTETCQDGIYFCSVREYNGALPTLSIAVLK